MLVRMPYKCVVRGCNSGYKTCKTKRHMFKVPKHPELREKWEKAISRDDFIFRDTTRVCDLHFERRFIQNSLIQSFCDESVKIPRTKPRLAPDAVPTLFLNCNNARKYSKTRKLPTLAAEPLQDDTSVNNSSDSESQKREKREERSPSVEIIVPDLERPSSVPLQDDTSVNNSSDSESQKREKRQERSPSVEIIVPDLERPSSVEIIVPDLERPSSVEIIVPDLERPSCNSTDNVSFKPSSSRNSEVRKAMTISPSQKRRLTGFRLKDLKEMYKLH